MSKILLVDADFYKELADELVRGAVAQLSTLGLQYERLSVPGALEIPATISLASKRTKGEVYMGYVALGCVIRGETSHYDIVCNESARALQQLALERDLAIGNGILTVDDVAQAWARASVSGRNKGRDAVMACLSLVKIRQRYFG